MDKLALALDRMVLTLDKLNLAVYRLALALDKLALALDSQTSNTPRLVTHRIAHSFSCPLALIGCFSIEMLALALDRAV